VALIKKTTGAAIGGITYRPFAKEQFAEIAFCAVTASEQVRGYGTRLMNYTKHNALAQDGCGHFLTYADNSAVGYFAKQGFTKEITLAREVWVGFIKDYDGGTLMECVIHARVPHTDMPTAVKRQKGALWARLKEISDLHLIHAAPRQFVEARAAYEAACAEAKREANAEGQAFTPPEFRPPPLDPAQIRGLADAASLSSVGPGVPESSGILLQGNVVGERRDQPPTRPHLHAFFLKAWQEMSQHKDAWPFLAPVDANEVPDYYNVIKDPMDLETIRKRVEAGDYYRSLEMFVADFRTIFRNCRYYNAPETVYFKAAEALEKHLELWIRDRVRVKN